ncbi:olfactory receptor 52B2-like [Lampetra planeri]
MASSNFSSIAPPTLPHSDLIVMVTPFGDPPSVRFSLVGTLFLLFTAAVAGNALLCFVVCLERRLRTPMCTFIASLALTDIVQVVSSVPRVMANLLGDDEAGVGGRSIGRVSMAECTVQMFLIHVSVRAQAFLLALMSVDRYLAVGFPLRYCSLMTNGIALRASAAVAASACALTCPNVALLVGLDYCRTRVLAAVYCSFYSVAFTSCGDVGTQRRYGYATLALATVLPACAVALAYALILLECRKAGLRRGQRKALRTCVTHLLAVGAFFASVFFSFANNISFLAGVGAEVSYCLQGLHCIVPALVNPVIYGLGTAEIRRGCVKRFRRRVADVGR